MCRPGSGISPCRPPGSSRPTSSRTRPGAGPAADPAHPAGNGGAFGGKVASRAPAAARELADRYGRPVRVVFSREDVVRLGPKRPPVAAGVRADGTGVIRTAAAPGMARAIRGRRPRARGRGGRRSRDHRCRPPSGAPVGPRRRCLAAAAANLDSNRRRSGPGPLLPGPSGGRAEAEVEVDAIGRPTACGGPRRWRRSARRGGAAVLRVRRRSHGSRLGVLGGHRGWTPKGCPRT